MHSWEDKGVHAFPKGICRKLNIIVRLQFEFACFDSAVDRFNDYIHKRWGVSQSSSDDQGWVNGTSCLGVGNSKTRKTTRQKIKNIY